jgi:flagellar biosynthesis/type III secretory pathway protein FliH
LDHTFRDEDRVVIAEFHGVGPFRGTVIQADEEQVEVLVDEEEDNKHFCTVYSENFRLLFHKSTEETQTIEQAFEAGFRVGKHRGRDDGYQECSSSSTLQKEKGKRPYTVTAKRLISRLVLK